MTENTDNEELQKCLIEIAEIAPKFLKSILDQVFEFCINVNLLTTAIIWICVIIRVWLMMIKVLVHNDAVSRKHLALEVIVTLAENASGMIRKNAAKYIPMIG